MSTMDFKNTKTAFSYKSKKELKSSLFVYRIITKPFMVSLGKFFLKIALGLRIPIKPFTNFMFKQFCGGETLEDVVFLADKISKYNVKSIPDYSIEGAANEESFNKLTKEVKSVIDLASKNKSIPFAVFKPTGLIDAKFLETKSPENHPALDDYINRLEKIFSYASSKNVKVLVDAEDYAYQERIDKILLEFIQKYNSKNAIIFTTLQMYRKDRFDYLFFLIDIAKRDNFKLGIKFVRGAYMEKERQRAKENNYPDPIHDTKKHTDKSFDEAIKLAIENISHVEIFNGTHNEGSNLKLTELMNLNNLKNNDPRIFFSQLYGMRDNISFNLASKGYNVAKYVPYGPIKEVLPYLVRRAEENSSMGSQAKLDIEMLKEELSNRKS